MRLTLLRRRGASVPVPAVAGQPRAFPPGTVRFETAWARRRFVPIELMGDAIHFVAPRTRHWPGQTVREAGVPQTVARGVLPDTVTCGSGYIEVLAFVEGGIVINEVRTQGDRVIAIPGWSSAPG